MRNLVLLSGGFDSTAALAYTPPGHTRAIFFDYGQPSRDAEENAALRAAAAFEVPIERVVLADTLRSVVGRHGLLAGVVDHDPEERGINAAFVPGRNLVFLSSALAHALAYWPDEPEIALVVGFCQEDAGGFPDCSRAFVDSFESTLSLGSNRRIQISAPWIAMPKREILDIILNHDDRASTVDALSSSWSCYRPGPSPCERCTACVLRAGVFRDRALVDFAHAGQSYGGDVFRSRTR